MHCACNLQISLLSPSPSPIRGWCLTIPIIAETHDFLLKPIPIPLKIWSPTQLRPPQLLRHMGYRWTGHSGLKIKWFTSFCLESIRKHGLSCKAIHFLYGSQCLKLIWLHFVVCSSHTRSNSPVNWLCIKFAIRWFVQMVSTMHGLLSSHTPHPRLFYTYGLFPTPPTRSRNLGRKVILTSFLVCTCLLYTSPSPRE